jgi:ethanolaminephosphotransferase
MVLYGDDTWSKLFPGFFIREDPTTSFFVSDYTQVTSNADIRNRISQIF